MANLSRFGGVPRSSIYLSEQAAAQADVAGSGQFWVKNDTPNIPMFTDDAGTIYSLRSEGKQATYIPVDASSILPITAGPITLKAADANFKDPFYYIPFDGTSIEVATFFWKPPARWNVGTLSAKFIWVASTNAAALTVSWNLQAYAYSDGEDLSNEATSGQQVVDSTTNDLKDLLISAETPALTIQGTPAAGDLLEVRIVRNPTADTYTADAWLRGVELFWTTDDPTDD